MNLASNKSLRERLDLIPYSTVTWQQGWDWCRGRGSILYRTLQLPGNKVETGVEGEAWSYTVLYNYLATRLRLVSRERRTLQLPGNEVETGVEWEAYSTVTWRRGWDWCRVRGILYSYLATRLRLVLSERRPSSPTQHSWSANLSRSSSSISSMSSQSTTPSSVFYSKHMAHKRYVTIILLDFRFLWLTKFCDFHLFLFYSKNLNVTVYNGISSYN